MKDELPLEDVALIWALRTADPEFRDWSAFAAWANGDPARNLAYDRAAAALAQVAAPPVVTDVVAETATIIPMRRPAPAPAAAPRVRRYPGFRVAAGMALAASVAGVLMIGRPADAPAERVIETRPGIARTIDLPEGSRIELAGGSRIRLDPARPRLASIDRGRAVFTVRHDAKAPFHVHAGGHRIVDIGTVFEVSQDKAATLVAVAEGAVMIAPSDRGPDRGLRLDPGQAVALRPGQAPRVERVEPDAVGQWRRGHMSYDDAPLTVVAADLSAAWGQAVVVDAGAGKRRFSGTITPANLRNKPAEAAALFGVRVVAGPDGWTLQAR